MKNGLRWIRNWNQFKLSHVHQLWPSSYVTNAVISMNVQVASHTEPFSHIVQFSIHFYFGLIFWEKTSKIPMRRQIKIWMHHRKTRKKAALHISIMTRRGDCSHNSIAHTFDDQSIWFGSVWFQFDILNMQFTYAYTYTLYYTHVYASTCGWDKFNCITHAHVQFSSPSEFFFLSSKGTKKVGWVACESILAGLSRKRRKGVKKRDESCRTHILLKAVCRSVSRACVCVHANVCIMYNEYSRVFRSNSCVRMCEHACMHGFWHYNPSIHMSWTKKMCEYEYNRVSARVCVHISH